MWYSNYSDTIEKLKEAQSSFMGVCAEKGLDPIKVRTSAFPQLVARAVFESNWQEGIHLEKGKTRKFSQMALDEMPNPKGPSLDIVALAKSHQRQVRKLFKNGSTVEEVGAYNLSAAHIFMAMLHEEHMAKMAAGSVNELRIMLESLPKDSEAYGEVAKLLNKFTTNDRKLTFPAVDGSKTSSELYNNLAGVERKNLVHPFTSDQLNFLHRITMMGLLPPGECGRFRKISVHVGNDDLFFPPPIAVPTMIESFCSNFPVYLDDDKDDWMMMAAKFSHKFVSIHPYVDGNGRVSRILMNGVLMENYFPVYLKADKKGRHRYGQALKRADRGNLEPLAALIAISTTDIFHKLTRSLTI